MSLRLSTLEQTGILSQVESHLSLYNWGIPPLAQFVLLICYVGIPVLWLFEGVFEHLSRSERIFQTIEDASCLDLYHFGETPCISTPLRKKTNGGHGLGRLAQPPKAWQRNGTEECRSASEAALLFCAIWFWKLQNSNFDHFFFEMANGSCCRVSYGLFHCFENL